MLKKKNLNTYQKAKKIGASKNFVILWRIIKLENNNTPISIRNINHNKTVTKEAQYEYQDNEPINYILRKSSYTIY